MIREQICEANKKLNQASTRDAQIYFELLLLDPLYVGCF